MQNLGFAVVALHARVREVRYAMMRWAWLNDFRVALRARARGETLVNDQVGKSYPVAYASHLAMLVALRACVRGETRSGGSDLSVQKSLYARACEVRPGKDQLGPSGSQSRSTRVRAR